MRSIKSLALSACLAWAFSCAPALAGITQIAGTGTGGAIANTGFAGSATINLTTTHDIPLHSLAIGIVQGDGVIAQNFSVTDTYGNTWTCSQSAAARANASTNICWTYTAFDIPNAGTVTGHTTSGSTNNMSMTLIAFSGSASSPYDSASPVGITGSGVPGTLTIGPTGTLNGPCGSANCEVLVGAIILNASGTVTMDSNYTAVAPVGASSPYMVGFRIVSAATASSYAPSTTAATTQYAGQLQAFKAAIGGNKLMFRSIP
jgi:hypothetical protein